MLTENGRLAIAESNRRRAASVPLGVRFEAKMLRLPLVECWLWAGATNGVGYGRMAVPRGSPRIQMAHRVAYELYRGPIPEGLTLDHLCRVPLCVRPDHLEAVPMRENILRGSSLSARRARQTTCRKGHVFDEANTYFDPKRGSRRCRACTRALEARRVRQQEACDGRGWR